MKLSMKRKLQIRFILLSMAALLLLQGAIVSFSIRHSYQDIVEKSDILLAQLKDTPSVNSLYFSVKIHPQKGTVRIDTTQNLSVTQEQAEQYAHAVLNAEEAKGFVDGYRYHIYRNENGTRILFLSRQTSLDMHRNASRSLLLFSAAGLVVMAIVLTLISGLVVAPWVNNDKKQKQFVTSAAHQLKTPLTVIRTQAQLLYDEIGDNEWLTGIVGQADHLSDMTQNLLTLVRSDEHGDTLCAETFSLTEIANETADLYMILAKKNSLTLSTEIQEDLNYFGNPKEIQQLLSILLDNAVKYCCPNGTIHLVVRKEFRGNSIRITNTATDLGSHPASAFTERFFRGENAANTNGSGLGLAIAQAITNHHKGKLTVTTTESCFCVHVMLH